MARTVAGGQQSAQAQPQGLPEGVVIDQPVDLGAQPSNARGDYRYVPSERTLQKLASFKFWPQVKERFGLDIEAVKRDANRYGVLEGLAHGSFTSEPLFLKIKANNQKTIKGFFTVRLYTNPETGDWGIELHKVNLKYRTDENGNYVKDPRTGEYQRTFDRNPIKEGDVIFYDGAALSKEDTDHLRLTGALGKPLTTVKFDGSTVNTIVSPDPYNQHELIGISSDAVRKRLFTDAGRVYRDKSSGLSYPLSDKQLGEIAIGRIVEVASAEDKSKSAFLMYDAARNQMVKTVSYEYALKRELARKEQEQLGRQLAREQAKAKGQAHAANQA